MKTMTGVDTDEIGQRAKLAYDWLNGLIAAVNAAAPPAVLRLVHGDIQQLCREVERLAVAQYAQGYPDCVERECEHVVDEHGDDIPDLDLCPQLERCVATGDDARRLNRIRNVLKRIDPDGAARDIPADPALDLEDLQAEVERIRHYANDDLDD